MRRKLDLAEYGCCMALAFNNHTEVGNLDGTAIMAVPSWHAQDHAQ